MAISAMTLARFFEQRLGAPLRNHRWSWGAVSPSTGDVYLRVWDDEFEMVGGRRCVRLVEPHDPSHLTGTGRAHPGARERQAHVQAIRRKDARAFGVILTAVDRQAAPRRMASFLETSLLVGGEVVEDEEGGVWLEDAGRCDLPAASARRPRLVSSPPRSGERPGSAERVDRRGPPGVSPPPAGHGSSSPAFLPPGTRPGRRQEGRGARETPERAAGGRGESRPGGAREGGPVREGGLGSLQRAFDAPAGVFAARESGTDNSRERHRARSTALQLLYQWEVGGIGAGDLDDALDLFWTVHPAPAARRELALGLARGAVGALSEIDLLIARHTDNWRSERLAVVDRLIMRLAVYELLYERTPSAVAINEALELARTFGGERSVAFVNGVLDAVRRAVRDTDPEPAGTGGSRTVRAEGA